MDHVDAGADETSVTTHVTDIHFHSDSQADNHHSASHTLSPADDISFKQPNTVQPSLLAVLLLALMFVALNPSSLRMNWLSSRVQHYFNQHRNTPPLRAPPHA